MRYVDLIVLHCTATPNGRPHTAADVDRWHAERGFQRRPGWRQRMNPSLAAIGYHFLIWANGALETGRHLDEPGAHAAGYNANSVGVALVGTDRYTKAQWDTLKRNVEALLRHYTREERGEEIAPRVVGHRDLGAKKTCPGFAVADWLQLGMRPREEWVLQ